MSALGVRILLALRVLTRPLLRGAQQGHSCLLRVRGLSIPSVLTLQHPQTSQVGVECSSESSLLVAVFSVGFLFPFFGSVLGFSGQ